MWSHRVSLSAIAVAALEEAESCFEKQVGSSKSCVMVTQARQGPRVIVSTARLERAAVSTGERSVDSKVSQALVEAK